MEAAIRLAIGESYAKLNFHQVAVPHVEKAVAFRRAILGTDHSDTLGSMERLAGTYGMAGRSRDAVILLEDVLDKYERLYGSDHPTTIDALSRLANACRQAGMWDRAIPLTKQVLEKRTATLGSTHVATVGAMTKLAVCYRDMGSFEESIAWYEKTLNATQAPDVLALNGYARTLQGAGKLEEADCQLRKTLQRVRKLSDRRERDNEIAIVLKILGLNLLLQERYAQAEPVAREALAIMEKERPDDWSRFHATSMVGGSS